MSIRIRFRIKEGIRLAKQGENSRVSFMTLIVPVSSSLAIVLIASKMFILLSVP